MNYRNAARALVIAAVIAVIWLGLPVYGFYGHNGKTPLPPFGWITLDESAPAEQQILNPVFAQAGGQALEAISKHRAAIGAPAISAAVLIGDELVWRGSAGWADIEALRPAKPVTQFRIGSTSKALTATALARMVDKGIIDLDTPIGRYLNELPNPEWASITPRHLASHMSGMPHYKRNGDLVGLYKTVSLRQHFDDVRDAVNLFDGSPLLFEPGTQFYYSSLGTVLLGAVVSEAAGKSYREIIEQEVLQPAGAQSTIVAPRTGAGHPDLATFYFREGNRYREWRPVDLSHRLPGGGYASTPSDLVRIGGLQWKDGFINPETRAAFWMPQVLANGEVNEQDYAIGWRWREYDIEGVGLARNANHGGVSRGAQSWLLVFPDYEMSIAFNINCKTEEFADFGLLYKELFAIFAKASTSVGRQGQQEFSN